MNGLLLINKPKDFTSRDVVNKVGRILNTKKLGHSGTLDPLATGVLVLLVGNATKLNNLITSTYKEYICEVKIGIETDTLDITGNIIKQKEYKITKKEIIKELNSFKGKYNQTVPKYSAVKVNGRKLYEYARQKVEVELPKREVEIKSIEFISFNKDLFTFKCLVSKGTYIRSLVKDIGDKLDIPMTMNNLIRTKQGNFDINDSYTIEDIEKGNYKLISLKEALKDYKQIEVNNELKNKILNGQILDDIYKKEIIVFVSKEEVIAIYEPYHKNKTKIKPIYVFN